MADKENKVAETAQSQPENTEKKPKKNKVKFSERVKKFWRDYKSEFKKISWPSKEETAKSTVVVIISIVVCAIVIGVLDLAFSKGLTLLSHL